MNFSTVKTQEEELRTELENREREFVELVAEAKRLQTNLGDLPQRFKEAYLDVIDAALVATPDDEAWKAADAIRDKYVAQYLARKTVVDAIVTAATPQ